MRSPLAISTIAMFSPTIVSPGRTEERQSSVTVYTSPEINPGEIDREIIDQVGAGGYIDFTAFVLSDSPSSTLSGRRRFAARVSGSISVLSSLG